MTDQENPEAQEIYTNSVNVNASIYEFVLQFGLTTPGEEAKLLARVRMSPQHALALLHLLEKSVEAYGDQFKEIFLPDDLVMRLKKYEETEETGESVPEQE